MDAKTIAGLLNCELHGDNTPIHGHGSLSNWKPGDVVFVKSFNTKTRELLATCHDILAIVPANRKEGAISVPYIESNNPRLDFIRVVRAFFMTTEIEVKIHDTAVVEDGAVIDPDVAIGAHCYIGPEVSVGSGTVIMPNVSIYGKVTIGRNCYIKPGAVIGGPGFGFEYDENGVPLQFPHSGEIIIGDNVYVGANATIDRGTIDDTVIEDNVKIDNLVHIAHNCHVGKNTLMTGCSTISGGVQVGEGSWIAPNSTVYQKVKIGEKSVVGIGAVVLRNVDSGKTVFGNPAKELE